MDLNAKLASRQEFDTVNNAIEGELQASSISFEGELTQLKADNEQYREELA